MPKQNIAERPPYAGMNHTHEMLVIAKITSVTNSASGAARKMAEIAETGFFVFLFKALISLWVQYDHAL